MNRKIKMMLSVVLMGLLIGTFGLDMVSGQNYYSEVEVDVRLEPGPEYVNPERQNIGTSESIDELNTNVDIWSGDMESDFPKGVYRGPLFEPSLVELNYKPRWRKDMYDDGGQLSSAGEFAWTTLIQQVEFSSTEIMNGASEWWIQVPVPADSLHIKRVIREGGNNIREYYSSVHVYEGGVTNIDVSMENTAITHKSQASYGGETVYPGAVAPIMEDNYYNNRPYVKINSFIEPQTTYTIVFNLLTHDRKPQLFITDSFNFEPFSIQYYREKYTSNTAHIDGVSIMENAFIVTQSGTFSLHDFEEKNVDSESTDVHLATSFIFTKGVGNHYMFGRQIHVEAGDTLLFFPDVDWSTFDSSSYNYTSFYLPFISDDNIGDGDVKFGWYFMQTPHPPYHHYNWELPTWNYTDYILYTDPTEINNAGISGSDIISLEFDKDMTLTLLFTAKELEYDSVDYGGTTSTVNTHTRTRWQNSKMLHFGGQDWDGNTMSYHNHEWYYYSPYIAAELTEGVWAQMDSTSEGKESYSHVFESSAYFSDIHLEIEGSGGTSWSQRIELVDKVFRYTIPVYGVARWAFRAEDGEGAGNPIEAVKDIVQGGITRMIDTARKIVGYIYDGLRWLLNTILDVLNIIYNAIIEFVGWFVNLLQDVSTVLGVIAERTAFIAGMIAFVAIIAMVSKVSKVVDLGGG